MGQLHLQGVSKRWRTSPVLDGVDLSVEPGTSVWVGGKNGAGKTTLLRIVAGLIQADGGEISFDDLSPKANRRGYQRRIGFLSAGDRGLYARLSVRQNLELWARLSFVPRRECRGAVGKTLGRFALDAMADFRADRLSLGQRQRVRLALAFLHAPSLVLLDEPVNSLDDDGIELLDAALVDLLDSGGSFIWCSPNRPETGGIVHGYRIADGRLAASA
jgi:ABC-2 type transport system ATP-binding protein